MPGPLIESASVRVRPLGAADGRTPKTDESGRERTQSGRRPHPLSTGFAAGIRIGGTMTHEPRTLPWSVWESMLKGAGLDPDEYKERLNQARLVTQPATIEVRIGETMRSNRRETRSQFGRKD